MTDVIVVTMQDGREFWLLAHGIGAEARQQSIEQIEGVRGPLPKSLGLKKRQSDEPEFWTSGDQITEIVAGQGEVTPTSPPLYQWRLREMP